MSAVPPPRSPDGLRLAAVLWLAGARIGLWVLPFGTLRRLLPWVADHLPSPRLPRPSPVVVARSVGAASRAVPRATCLVQALATWGLLRHREIPGELHLGVRPQATSGDLGAHAWVEVAGKVVIGGEVSGHAGLGAVPLGSERG